MTGLDITASEEQALQGGLELGWKLKVAGIRERRDERGHEMPHSQGLLVGRASIAVVKAEAVHCVLELGRVMWPPWGVPEMGR